MADPTEIVLVDWKGEVGSRRRAVASATPICAGSAESADMSLSDREPAEGFHRSTMIAVAAAVPSRIDNSLTYTEYSSRRGG